MRNFRKKLASWVFRKLWPGNELNQVDIEKMIMSPLKVHVDVAIPSATPPEFRERAYEEAHQKLFNYLRPYIKTRAYTGSVGELVNFSIIVYVDKRN